MAGIALEHEPKHRCEYQQQPEDGEEAPVRDLNAERISTGLEKLLDHGDRNGECWGALLSAVQATECVRKIEGHRADHPARAVPWLDGANGEPRLGGLKGFWS